MVLKRQQSPFRNCCHFYHIKLLVRILSLDENIYLFFYVFSHEKHPIFDVPKFESIKKRADIYNF